MCGGSDSPPPPDPMKTAQAQALFNKEAAIEAAKLNAIDQTGPFGSTTFQRRADGTPMSQSVTLSPEMQKWLDSQFGASTKLQETTSRQLDYLPTDKFQLPTGSSADSLARDAFGNAVLDPSSFDTSKIAQTSYDQATSLMRPDLDMAKKEAEIRLGQRGIPVGSEIWNQEMDRINRGETQALSSAARQAQLDAGNEQTRAIGNAVTARNYGSNTFQTNLGNKLLERNQPFSEAAALMGTTPQFQTPSFMNTSAQSVAAPDYSGGVYNAYNAQVQAAQNKNSALGGILGGLGSAAGKFLTSPTASIAGYTLWSDERMKEGIEPEGEDDGETVLLMMRNMEIPSWQYKPEAQEALGVDGERHTGPMAREFADNFGGDGQTIDVATALGKLMQAVKALDKRTASAGAM